MQVKAGIAVSPGIAIARAFPLESEEFVVSSRPVAAESLAEEASRFVQAVPADPV